MWGYVPDACIFTVDPGPGEAALRPYAQLLGAYDRGEIAESVIADLMERNNTLKKVEMIRSQLGG